MSSLERGSYLLLIKIHTSGNSRIKSRKVTFVRSPTYNGNNQMANNGIEDTFLYRSTDVARYLVFLANERKITVNMTKVQKLLYITYGVFLRVYSRRLLNEHLQAGLIVLSFPATRNNLLKQDFSLVPKESIRRQGKNENDEKLNKVVDFVFKEFWFLECRTIIGIVA